MFEPGGPSSENLRTAFQKDPLPVGVVKKLQEAGLSEQVFGYAVSRALPPHTALRPGMSRISLLCCFES